MIYVLIELFYACMSMAIAIVAMLWYGTGTGSILSMQVRYCKYAHWACTNLYCPGTITLRLTIINATVLWL